MSKKARESADVSADVRARARDDGEAAAVWVPLASLTAWARNPRRNDAAVPAVMESIKRFGFAAPIIARRADGEIIAGHTRAKAAEALGLERVPVRFLDLDPADAHLLALADNKLNEKAEWDDAAVMSILSEYGLPDAELAGWDAKELDALADSLGANDASEVVEDEAPEPPAEAVTKPGDVWLLGRHRLLCGDSTSASSWRTVLRNGERLQMLWTDPPYGVKYVGKTDDALTIQNDDLDNDGLESFLGDALGAAREASEPGAAWYVAAPAGPRGVQFAVVLLRLGAFRQRLVWVKDRFVLGHSDYHYRHEDIYFGYVPGATGRRGRGGEGWFSDNSQDSVLDVPRPSANKEHPTIKPVDLVARCLNNSSRPGWLVGEPFGGSGTTLIAAEQLGRNARVIELDPRYCDVIVKRWETLTGQKAKLERTDAGQTDA